MIKYLILLQLILFLQSIEVVYSQTVVDSTSPVNTRDTVLKEMNDSNEKADSDSEAFVPISDTILLTTGPIRKVSQRNVNAYLKNPDYAYANDPEYWRERAAPKKQGSILKLINGRIFQWTIFLMIIGIVLYGIYHLAKESNFNWLSRNKSRPDLARNDSKEEAEIDLDAAILTYQLEGNYRLAIRFMYLKLIKTIRESGKILVRGSSTNAEIGLAFAGHPNAMEFRYLTTAYEYIFYGDFKLPDELFDQLKKKFDDFQQNLSV